MITKTERVAVLFDPTEKAVLDEAIALFCREKGIRSIKSSVLLRDILMQWAEEVQERAKMPSLFAQMDDATQK